MSNWKATDWFCVPKKHEVFFTIQKSYAWRIDYPAWELILDVVGIGETIIVFSAFTVNVMDSSLRPGGHLFNSTNQWNYNQKHKPQLTNK